MNDEIDKAIEQVASQPAEPPAAIGVGIPIMTEAIELPADGGVRFNQRPEDGKHGPRLLLLDVNTGAWRPILLPPGMWALAREGDVEPPKPQLWRPS